MSFHVLYFIIFARCTQYISFKTDSRHNGKVERSRREDQKRFYSCNTFFSLADFEKQLAAHNRYSNNLPMRPLSWASPSRLVAQYV